MAIAKSSAAEPRASAATTLARLTERFGDQAVLRPRDGDPRYQEDWTGDYVGRAAAVLRPRDTTELARMVAFCAEARLPLVAQGGLTGLTGAGVPTSDGREIVVSLERMNRVRKVDPLDFTMEVEAGCILEEAKAAAAAVDCHFPLTLGAQGSCRIGGNIATNAGGVNVLRYGMTRDLVLGLEVVLPDGTVWDGLRALRKNNTGYDLKQLFIGAEGTLGIVTAAVLKLFPAAEQTETALLAVPNTHAAMRLMSQARRACSDLLSAFELIPRSGLDLAFEAMPDLPDPLSGSYPHYVLLEASASGYVELRPIIERFLAEAIEAGTVLDGTMAANSNQAREIWLIREAMNEAQRRRGLHFRTDVSVPVSKVAAFIDEAMAAIEDEEGVELALAYGHVGDGNIHLNVLPQRDLDTARRHALFEHWEEVVFGIIDQYEGSISAEHGIGLLKRDAFRARISPVHLSLVRGIKHLVDPRGLMAPGRLVPPDDAH